MEPHGTRIRVSFARCVANQRAMVQAGVGADYAQQRCDTMFADEAWVCSPLFQRNDSVLAAFVHGARTNRPNARGRSCRTKQKKSGVSAPSHAPDVEPRWMKWSASRRLWASPVSRGM